MSTEALRKAFRDQQLAINTIRASENDLKRKLADKENAEKGDDEDGEPQRKRRRGKKANSSDEGEKYIAQVNHLAHKYVIMFGLWMHAGKGTFTTDIDPTYIESGRFDSSESKIQWQLADLLGVLPEMLKSTEMLESEWLPDRFCSEMGQQRSNTASRIRKELGALIFRCMPEDMLSDKRRVELFNAKNGWLADSEGNGKGVHHTWDAEILHAHFSGEFDINSAFLSPVLLRTFAAIIHGRAGVTALLNDTPIVRKGGVIASVLNLRNTTPGAIAAVAVVARWAVSADPELCEQGSATGINYSDMFDDYLQYLKKGLRLKSRSVCKIFQIWDKTFFAATADTGLAAGEKTMDDATAKVLAMLDDEEPIEEEEGQE